MKASARRHRKPVNSLAKRKVIENPPSAKTNVATKKTAPAAVHQGKPFELPRATSQASNTSRLRGHQKRGVRDVSAVRTAAASIGRSSKSANVEEEPALIPNPMVQLSVANVELPSGSVTLRETPPNPCNALPSVQKPVANVVTPKKKAVPKATSVLKPGAKALTGKSFVRTVAAETVKQPENPIDREANLERRIEKLEAVVWKDAQGTGHEGQIGKRVDSQPQINTEPSSAGLVVANAQVSHVIAQEEPSEHEQMKESGGDRTSNASVTVKASVLVGVPSQQTQAADPPITDAKDLEIKPATLPDFQASEILALTGQILEPIITDGPSEKPQEANLIPESLTSVDETPAMIDIPEEPMETETPQPACAGSDAAPNPELEKVKATEMYGKPAAEPPGPVDEAAEKGCRPENVVVPGVEAGEPTAWKGCRRKKVLVIDDDATMRMLLTMGLRSQDYDCLTAENGKEAQAMLQTHRPDLILVDLLMPVMDGLTFIRWLRQTAGDSTPVLVFTNIETPRITQEALASGANSFVCKPLHLKELLEVMSQLVPD